MNNDLFWIVVHSRYTAASNTSWAYLFDVLFCKIYLIQLSAHRREGGESGLVYVRVDIISQKRELFVCYKKPPLR